MNWQGEERFVRAREKIRRAFFREEPPDIPFQIWTRPYFSFGATEGTMPEDYYTNPASMTAFQEEGWARHLEHIEDDSLPFLMPWYGTGVLASAFGCEVRFPPGADPSVARPCVESLQDAAQLKLPNPERNGLMPTVLETITYMRSHSSLPVGLTDCQGPLDTLCQMCGYERLFLWMYDEPQAVHELFALVTEALIEWVKVPKECSGHAPDETPALMGASAPKGCGLWLSEDDATLISAEMYEEFVLPYHNRIFNAFEGGALHYCGSAAQHIENLRKMENLKALNICALGDFGHLQLLQEQLGDQMSLYTSDHAPTDVETFYTELVETLDPWGLIIAAFVDETVALSEGNYIFLERDPLEIGQRIAAALRRAIGNKLEREYSN